MKESLPPARLTESIARSSGMGQGLVFSKNPAPVDPIAVKKRQSTDTENVSSPSKSFEPGKSLEEKLAWASENKESENQPSMLQMNIMAPSNAFRRETMSQSKDRVPTLLSQTNQKFPEFLDFVVAWETQTNSPAGLVLPLEAVLVALQSHGNYDILLEFGIIHLLKTQIAALLKDAKTSERVKQVLTAFVESQEQQKYPLDIANAIRCILDDVQKLPAQRWTEHKYNATLKDVVTSRGSDFELQQILSRIESDLLLLVKTGGNSVSLSRIERLLIALLGDDRPNARETSVRLLNMLYDRHEWQSMEALTPVIRTIGDAFVVEVDCGQGATPSVSNLYLLVYSPAVGQSGGQYILSHYVPTASGSKLAINNLPSFRRTGYYDWRLVTLTKDGQFAAFTNPNLSLSQVQGRVIVHPNVKEENIHEIFVDLQGADVDKSGRINRKGNYGTVSKSLQEYKRNFSVTSVYVMGVLDRLATAHSPFGVTDRSNPSKWLGGEKDFEEIITTANELGMKVFVDSTNRISSKGSHRKYRNHICYLVDDVDQSYCVKPHPGTDGQDFKWSDCLHLNYRKKAVWDLLISEITAWAKRGVAGVRLDGAHSWPTILKPDNEELLKEDTDGQYHYSFQEIMDGDIVLPSSDEAVSFGYYGTTASSTYPNPLFIKLTREIWTKYPNFVFFAEVFWSRERMALRSGLIPYATSLARCLQSIFNIGIHKEGTISYLNEKRNVSVFYDWYQVERSQYPQNSIIVYPSSSHHLPYPTAIYGHAAWVAVDLLYFLPEIPMTFVGEQLGWVRDYDIGNNRLVAPSISVPVRGDLSSIKGHYEHRAMMRRNYSVLREGGMIPLFGFYKGGWHDRVFAFARFSAGQDPNLAIIAINFNDVESFFYLDCSPLKDMCETGGEILYRTVDLINPSNAPQYFTPDEFLHENNYVLLPPYGSLCWGVYVQQKSPGIERFLYEHSMSRLMRKIVSMLDPSHNMIYNIILEGLQSLDKFADALRKITRQQGPTNEHNLPSLLQTVLYYIAGVAHSAKASQMLAILNEISQSQISSGPSPTPYEHNLVGLCNSILQYNIVGPIVFVTPEIGRFSTVGGVGVMLDELTRALAVLGAEIHIISPYYNYNRKGNTDYLKAEGINYKQNVATYVGNEYVEVGVHYGYEYGVHLHFLHNFKFFTTPYHIGSPTHQLQTIVLMAKASLELCCQLRLLPSLIVSNDWFTGLVPAYAKRSGAFGTTFSGTTMFHLVHNLEEGYEGKIYNDDDDLGHIHQLSKDLIMEPAQGTNCLNASRAALLASDQWGTVSLSYRNDLLRVSPLAYLLKRFPAPFANLNGIRLNERLELLKKIAPNHDEAKAILQKKYFGHSDPSMPVFSFVGRIVLQKGVHLILNAVHEIINLSRGKIQIIVGGMANMRDPYAAQCAWSMQALRKQYPNNFWADPNEFFTDGPLLNLGSDFALMPSLFEPSGVVQQEFFAGGTPVIAFKTGGLKDSVFEFHNGSGNGFTFEAHAHVDFVQAVRRALVVYNNKSDYLKLRENARACVLDVIEVATAWMGEFVRLRKRVWAPPEEVEKIRKEFHAEANKESKTDNNSA